MMNKLTAEQIMKADRRTGSLHMQNHREWAEAMVEQLSQPTEPPRHWHHAHCFKSYGPNDFTCELPYGHEGPCGPQPPSPAPAAEWDAKKFISKNGVITAENWLVDLVQHAYAAGQKSMKHLADDIYKMLVEDYGAGQRANSVEEKS